MMTRARREIVSLDATPYYHIMSRCVRRAFLCGFDRLTNRDFSHRKEWFKDRLVVLEAIFCIDIAAFALMSNHYHLVVFINQQKANNLSDDQIIQRWTQLYKPPILIQKYLDGIILNETEMQSFKNIIEEWRQRLMSLSWYARCLNEYMAKRANKEDECTGRFWEGRFKSQALLDDKALLTCMAYVDLNPIRAQSAKTLKCSLYTSINIRLSQSSNVEIKNSRMPQFNLIPFSSHANTQSNTIPFDYDEYVQLLDWSARNLHNKPEFDNR